MIGGAIARIVWWVLSAFGTSGASAGLILPRVVSGGGDQVPQRGHALEVDDPPTGERDGLIDVAGRPEEVADLVEGAAEAMSRIEVLEAAHRPIASFYAPVI